MSILMSFGEKRSTKYTFSRRTESPSVSSQPISKPSVGELQLLPEDEALARRREWASAEQRRLQECARLCSQWPQSGYNMARWGPNGAKHFYQPQSISNPQYVASLMRQQAEVELHMCTSALTFYPCNLARRVPSRDGTEPSVESSESSQPSSTESMSTSSDEALAKTAAEIEAAMTTPLLPKNGLDSQVSLLTPSSSKSLKVARSMIELDSRASSMTFAKDGNGMDMDPADPACQCDTAGGRTRNRAQSCGAKRPLTRDGYEEDKRRKIDEAMVVEEAVDNGVIVPNKTSATCGQNPRLSASSPDLSEGRSDTPAVFGHVVKTSDTHPIIISPFFPAELLPILSAHLIVPQSARSFSARLRLMGSAIDVPSVLLSFIPSPPSSEFIPSPAQSAFRQQQIAQQEGQEQIVGNLLLSSCPGKRLRLGGPVKGRRGPVCRDLCTDLRRIKTEGVGCLICCLDDAELELLGVPWDTYSKAAASTDLDVIRIPMPDGLSPVSFSLFDTQINLIATRYSLHGTNVLVHCRGGVGRAGLTACAWAIKMGFVPPHPSLATVEQAAIRQGSGIPAELEHQIVMSIVERVIAMIRSRRGLKAIESFEQVQFLASYVRWLRAGVRVV